MYLILDICLDYPKIITFTEKWNLAVNFNCLEAIYFYAPSALAVRKWSI